MFNLFLSEDQKNKRLLKKHLKHIQDLQDLNSNIASEMQSITSEDILAIKQAEIDLNLNLITQVTETFNLLRKSTQQEYDSSIPKPKDCPGHVFHTHELPSYHLTRAGLRVMRIHTLTAKLSERLHLAHILGIAC